MPVSPVIVGLPYETDTDPAEHQPADAAPLTALDIANERELRDATVHERVRYQEDGSPDQREEHYRAQERERTNPDAQSHGRPELPRANSYGACAPALARAGGVEHALCQQKCRNDRGEGEQDPAPSLPLEGGK